jgi:hypothetical protein
MSSDVDRTTRHSSDQPRRRRSLRTQVIVLPRGVAARHLEESPLQQDPQRAREHQAGGGASQLAVPAAFLLRIPAHRQAGRDVTMDRPRVDRRKSSRPRGRRSAPDHGDAFGYDARWLLVDRGETAEAVVSAALEEKTFDCILIGAGIRTIPPLFLLFEKLVNVVHEKAPHAKICFNTVPEDTTVSVQRWV